MTERLKYFCSVVKDKPIYPILCGLLIPFIFYLNNLEEAYFSAMTLSVSFTLAYSIVIYFVGLFIFRDANKSAFMCFVVLLLTFGYGHVKNLIGDFTVSLGQFKLGVDKLLYGGLVLISAMSFTLIFISKNKLRLVTKTINVIVTTLLLINLLSFVNSVISGKAVLMLDKDTKGIEVLHTNNSIKDLPDIYHIVLDKYASNKVLSQAYGYDNRDFTDYLTSKGFYVVHEAKANYPHTLYSLSSTLNMDYAEAMTETVGKNMLDVNGELEVMFPLFRNHIVGQYLTAVGYEYFHIGNWFYPTQTSNVATQNMVFNDTGLRVNEFTSKYLQTTALEPILKKFFLLSESQQHLAAIRFGFSSLRQVIDKPTTPKFVFAHILIPHGPYVVDENCIDLNELIPEREGYLGSVKCANKQVYEIIDLIFEKTEGEVIIVVQSDEGPNVSRQEMPGDDYAFLNMSEEIIARRTSIQYAVYLPNGDYEGFSPTSTPVNTYRLILNKYFRSNYEILPDKTYITNTNGDLTNLRFIEVEADQ